LLHHAVDVNNLSACQMLVKRCPALINSLNVSGRTPFHLAAAPNRQAVFQLLSDAGADISQRDYEGYDVATHAFCHDTLPSSTNLLPILTIVPCLQVKKIQGVVLSYVGYLTRAELVDLQEFKLLQTNLIEEKEFSHTNTETSFSLSLYC